VTLELPAEDQMDQMEYLDFFVHLDRDENGLVVRVDADPYGRGAAKNPLGFDPATLPCRLKAIEQCLLCMLHPSATDRDKSRCSLEEHVRSLGADLFRVLSEGDVGKAFLRTLGQLDGDVHRGLRIRIASDPSDGHLHPMAAAAWEVIHDAKHEGFLGQRRRFPISRYFTGLGAIQELRLDGALRVLLVESQPKDVPPVQAAEEKAAIRHALEPIKRVEVVESPPHLLRVRDLILARGIHVLHFIGHGGFNAQTGNGWVTFANEDDSRARWPGDLLADRLKDLPTLRLVVLSNCYGGTLPRAANQVAFLTVAPALLRAKIPAVVAMQFPISDDAAIAFSRRFYERLAAFDPIDVATSEARMAIADLGQSPETRLQWPLPAVFMRVGDGCLLSPPAPTSSKPSGTRLDGGGTPDKPAKLRIGIRTFATGFGNGMEERVDRFLGLEDLFVGGRQPKETATWNGEVLSRLEDFLSKLYTERRELEFDFAAIWSVAFATGWFLEAKSGLDISIVQRTYDGPTIYHRQDGECPEGDLWHMDYHEIGTGTDLAIAISLTQDTLKDVDWYLRYKEGPQVGRVLHASVTDIGQGSVKSGLHALRLAQQLARALSMRSVPERRGTLHLFGAAPNAFTFFLGQLAGALGSTMLYEYPFREKDSFGDYRPSISFPPAGAIGDSGSQGPMRTKAAQ